MLRQFLFTSFLSFIIALPARAVSLLPLSLDQIISSSAIAFQGKVIESKIDRDPETDFVVTYITFKVQEVLKGTVEAIYTIKQIEYPLPPGIARLAVMSNLSIVNGSSNIYFLYGPSESGYSNSVGLEQGVFRIIEDPKVLRDFSPPASERYVIWNAPVGLEHIGLEEFKQLVRQKIGL